MAKSGPITLRFGYSLIGFSLNPQVPQVDLFIFSLVQRIRISAPG